jgi:hypothetical protein
MQYDSLVFFEHQKAADGARAAAQQHEQVQTQGRVHAAALAVLQAQLTAAQAALAAAPPPGHTTPLQPPLQPRNENSGMASSAAAVRLGAATAELEVSFFLSFFLSSYEQWHINRLIGVVDTGLAGVGETSSKGTQRVKRAAADGA